MNDKAARYLSEELQDQLVEQTRRWVVGAIQGGVRALQRTNEAFERYWNYAEVATGTDLDADGDVGQAGTPEDPE